MAWVSGPNLIVQPPDTPVGVGDFGPYEYTPTGRLYVVLRQGSTTYVYGQDSPLGPPNWDPFPYISGYPPVATCIDANDPAILHIVTREAGGAGNTLRLLEFDMSTETLSVISTSPALTFSTVYPFWVRSTPDGSIVIGYSFGAGVRTVRYKSGTWSSFVTIHTFATDVAAVGMDNLDDDVYLAYQEQGSSSSLVAQVRIIYPDDSLSAKYTAFTGDASSQPVGHNATTGGGPVMRIYGDEIFLQFIGVFTLRGSPVSAPSTWATDFFPDTSFGGPGGNYILLNGKLFAIWNNQQFDDDGNIVDDIMYGAQYKGGGVWCDRNPGMDFVDHPPESPPALAYPDNFSHVWSAHGLVDGSVGQSVDFLIDDGGNVTCTVYYANYTVLGCGGGGGVYPQRRRPRYVGNRR